MQVVYIGLAILLASGLVLFGIGTGTGGGGLLGGLSGSGSSNNQSGAVGKAAQQAQARVNKNPKDPAAWAALIQARYENAQSAGVDNAGFTNFGKQQLAQVTKEYEQYSKLVDKPDVTTATLRRPRLQLPGQLPPGSGNLGSDHRPEPDRPRLQVPGAVGLRRQEHRPRRAGPEQVAEQGAQVPAQDADRRARVRLDLPQVGSGLLIGRPRGPLPATRRQSRRAG